VNFDKITLHEVMDPSAPQDRQELVWAIQIVTEVMRARIDVTDGSGTEAVGRHQNLSEDNLQVEFAFLTPNIIRQARCHVRFQGARAQNSTRFFFFPVAFLRYRHARWGAGTERRLIML
jgi:hypothetical protein